jgi:hypothetical protein
MITAFQAGKKRLSLKSLKEDDFDNGVKYLKAVLALNETKI